MSLIHALVCLRFIRQPAALEVSPCCIFHDFRDSDYDSSGPMHLRRSFYELVAFLEKRLKRMKARVRFFLHETETRWMRRGRV